MRWFIVDIKARKTFGWIILYYPKGGNMAIVYDGFVSPGSRRESSRVELQKFASL